MISAILFDFFGVLSTPAYGQVIEKLLPTDGLAKWQTNFDKLDIGELSEQEFSQLIAQAAHVSELTVSALAASLPQLNRPLFDFVEAELLPRYAVGLLTNAPRDLVRKLLGDSIQLFDPVLISAELHLVKPSPEIFQAAIKRVGKPAAEIAFIDDTLRNVVAAQAAGLQALPFTTLTQLKADLKHLGI
jgi:putative hydrolase of the HAD superfamily